MSDAIRTEGKQHQVRIRLEVLRAMPFESLRGLPEWRSERVEFGNAAATLTTYCEPETDGRLRIVVQFMPEGMGNHVVWRGVYAEGFWISPDGEISVLPDGLRYGYM